MAVKMLKKALGRLGSFPEKELRRLVEAQIEEAELLESLLEQGGVGHLVSRSGRVFYANSLFSALVPSDRKWQGKTPGEVISDPEVLDWLASARPGAEADEEFCFQQGSEVRMVRLSLRQITVWGEDLLDYQARDVTEERRAEARLRRSENLASMTNMAAGIAHEIKNPLAAMRIHLQLMKKAFSKKGGLTEEEAKRYLSVIDEEIERLNSIAVDFLFAVRPMNVQPRKQRLEPVLKSLADFVRPELEDAGIKLTLTIEPFLPSLKIDSKLLRQAILNMVKNAENAMDGGGELWLDARRDGDWVDILVRDSGCGIEAEKLSKIFEPYFTTKASGTGLGLTVVYKIIKEHGGDISVESAPGEGTAFTIKLPVPSDERAALESSAGEDGNAGDPDS